MLPLAGWFLLEGLLGGEFPRCVAIGSDSYERSFGVCLKFLEVKVLLVPLSLGNDWRCHFLLTVPTSPARHLRDMKLFEGGRRGLTT